MSKKEIHVVPHPNGGWATRRPGTERVSDRHATQREAIDVARERARREQAELVIHGTNGRIRDKDSYGNDPCPPKDKRG